MGPPGNSHIQGVPKKMFPCLRGYNSYKKGATVKSKVSFEILRQFFFWWSLKFLHLDHLSLRKCGLKIATPLLELWQKQPSSDPNFFCHIERWITLYFLGWSQWKVDTINKDFNIEICCKGRCKDKNFTGNPCYWVWTPADAHSIYLLSFGSFSDVNHCWLPQIVNCLTSS